MARNNKVKCVLAAMLASLVTVSSGATTVAFAAEGTDQPALVEETPSDNDNGFNNEGGDDQAEPTDPTALEGSDGEDSTPTPQDTEPPADNTDPNTPPADGNQQLMATNPASIIEDDQTVFTGECGSSVKYSLDTVSGVLTISSSSPAGNTTDTFTPENLPGWQEHAEKITSVVIEKGVTQIAHFGPLYRFNVVQQMGYDSDEIAKTCPVCEEVFYRKFTHLPLYGLSDEQLKYMADAVLESLEELK